MNLIMHLNDFKQTWRFSHGNGQHNHVFNRIQSNWCLVVRSMALNQPLIFFGLCQLMKEETRLTQASWCDPWRTTTQFLTRLLRFKPNKNTRKPRPTPTDQSATRSWFMIVRGQSQEDGCVSRASLLTADTLFGCGARSPDTTSRGRIP